jgi:hypothetical protein
MADPAGKKVVRYYSAEVRVKDDFGVKFSMREGEVIYDAATIHGPWATMIQQSYDLYGKGKLGLGLGQKYVRQYNGELHKVEG